MYSPVKHKEISEKRKEDKNTMINLEMPKFKEEGGKKGKTVREGCAIKEMLLRCNLHIIKYTHVKSIVC